MKLVETLIFEVWSRKPEELAEAVDAGVIAKAKNTKAALQAKTKKEVFDAWVSETLPRINSATIGEQDKSNMIYDLVAKRHGVPTAKVLYKVVD